MSTFDVGSLFGTQNYSGIVDSSTPFHLYNFNLSSSGSFQASLGGLSNNADLQLLGSSGNILYSSSKSGTMLEQITVDLAAGSYAIRVGEADVLTNYNLSLSWTETQNNGEANSQIDPITGMGITSDVSNNPTTTANQIEVDADIDNANETTAIASNNPTTTANPVEVDDDANNSSEATAIASNNPTTTANQLEVDADANNSSETAAIASNNPTTTANPVVGTADSNNSTETSAIASDNNSTSPLVNNLNNPQNPSFNLGKFLVDATGIVGIDYLFDGGWFEGQLGIFSLTGMEQLIPHSDEFITEAARRAASSSELGHVVINDVTEGARFSGGFPFDNNLNKGSYLGVKTFNMRPGDTFAIILIPTGATMQQVADKSVTGNNVRPLFSLPIANPNGTSATGQIADVTGEGNTFVMEDIGQDKPYSDKDFNDIIFQVRGAMGSAVSIDSVINPQKEWRTSNMGQALIEYAKAYVTPADPILETPIESIALNPTQPNTSNTTTTPSGSPNTETTAIAPDTTKPNTPVETPTEGIAPEITKPDIPVVTVETPNNAIAPEITQPNIPVVTVETPNNAYAPEIIKPDIPVVTVETPIIAIAPEITKPDIPVVTVETPIIAIAPEITKPDIPVVTVETPTIAIAPEITKPDTPVETPTIAIAPEITLPDIPVVTVETPTIAIAPEITKPDTPVETPTIAIAPDTTKPDIPVVTVETPTIAIAPEITKPDIPVVTVETPAIAIAPEIIKPDIPVVTVETPTIAIAPEITKPDIPVVTVETPNIAIAPAPDTTKPNVPVANTTTVPPVEAAPPVQASVTQPIASTPAVSFNFPKADQPLVGTINTGFNANNPDIDYGRIILGKDRVDGDANPLLAVSKGDDSGTATLGIIGATQDNKIGINGVNDDAPLWVGRAGVNSDQWAQSLMEFVDAAKASKQPNAIINLGFNLTQTNPDGTVTPRYELTAAERAALAYAQRHNVIIVASAGDNPGQMSALGKASLEYDNIITVGAAERVNNSVALSKAFGLANYSGSGAGLDILAEGGTAEKPITVTSGEGTGNAFGTSLATATVTGAISQVWAANPKLNYTQVIDLLKRTATDLGKPNWDMQTGAGLLNITAAVNLAKITTPELYTVKPGQQTITDNFISQNNPSKQLPGDPTHPAAVPPGIPRTNVDQGANNLSGTRIRISATEDVIDQVSSIDPTDVYRGTSRELAGAKFKLLTGQAIVSVMSPSGQVLSRQVLSRGTHNLQMPANAPAEVLLKIDTNGTDATYVLQGFEAERNEPFDINLEFESPLTASQRQIMQAAAKSVASLIGKGLPSAVVDGKIIDDINIKISATNLDGVSGTQARTKIDFMRYGTLLPAQAITQFDAADLATLERSGQLFSVAQHEFLHALGFGNLWEAKGLVDYAGTPLAQYNGKQGVEAFKELGGLTDFISLETEGKGSAGFHWNEALFQDEVMTADLGFKTGADGGVFSPISGVTIASLADLGYEVNLNRATPDFGLFGGARFNPADLTPEQIEAFQQLALASAANQAGEFIPAIMPQVDPNKVAPEIWAHAERGPDGEYYDWEDYLIKGYNPRTGREDTLSDLAEERMGSGSPANYWWIANHNGIPDPNYIQAGKTIKLPVHRPNYEWEKEQERLQREAELKQKQEEEAQKQKEAEEKLKKDQAEQEKFKQEQERLKQEAEAKRKELEEQAKKLAEELKKKRQHEEWLKEQARLAELARQAEIARQQGKGGLDWYVAKPLPEFGPVDPFETSLTGETVGNLVPDDYYRFTLSRGGRITAELRKLLADADLVLYDVRNEPIAYSMREGVTDEFILADLIPGTYMLRVNSPKGVTTDYELIVKFKHKLSQMEIGPPPGWRVGGSNGNGGNGGVSGPTFADPRIQQIYNTALNRFAAAERAKANAQIKDLEAKKRQYEQDLEKLLAQMNAEQRAKIHAQLDSARDSARNWVDEFANPVKSGIDSTADWIINQIDSKIPGWIYNVWGIGDALRNGRDSLKGAINGARDWLKGKVSAVQTALKDSIWWFFERIKQAYRTGGEINAIIEDAARILNDEIARATNTINGLVNQFKGKVLESLGWLRNVGAFGWNFYDGVAEPLANSLASGVTSAVSGLGNTASKAVNVVKPLAQTAVAYIADAIFGDKTGHLYNQIHGVDQQIANIKAGVEKAINNQAAFYKRLLDDFVKGLGEAGNFVLGALMGEFNDNPSIWQTLLDTAIGMIPIVGEIGDVRDLIAYVGKFSNNPEEMQDFWNWLGVVGALIGLVPVAGGAIKGVTKLARNADLVKEINKLGEPVVNAIVDFARKTDWSGLAKQSSNLLTNKILGTIEWLLTKLDEGIESFKNIFRQLNLVFEPALIGGGRLPDERFFEKQLDIIRQLKREAPQKVDEAFAFLKGKLDEVVSSRVPAPDNYRGRYNADRAAKGQPRLPDDWDAHHAIPQFYKDHPEFQNFDFHDPSNIRGVKGSRADENIHQQITNDWAEFQRSNPTATRLQIENFAKQIDQKYSQHWFQ